MSRCFAVAKHTQKPNLQTPTKNKFKAQKLEELGE
jgi:hypothetical protein